MKFLLAYMIMSVKAYHLPQIVLVKLLYLLNCVDCGKSGPAKHTQTTRAPFKEIKPKASHGKYMHA